jgi:hypothetical protein
MLSNPETANHMASLGNSLRAWNTAAFAGVLKAELMGLGAGVLPLREAAAGGCTDESDVEITVLGASDSAAEIHVNVGVFFAEVIAGCSCGDEPSASNAYCELRVSIEKETGVARFSVIHD